MHAGAPRKPLPSSPAPLQRLAKPPGLTRAVVEWRQESVAALLGVQRSCSWLDVQHALEPEDTEAA